MKRKKEKRQASCIVTFQLTAVKHVKMKLTRKGEMINYLLRSWWYLGSSCSAELSWVVLIKFIFSWGLESTVRSDQKWLISWRSCVFLYLRSWGWTTNWLEWLAKEGTSNTISTNHNHPPLHSPPPRDAPCNYLERTDDCQVDTMHTIDVCAVTGCATR